MLKKLNKEDLGLIQEFLPKIDDDFAENKDINASPWKFIDEIHFQFFADISNNRINAVMVKSVHESSEHLNFLYVLQELRAQGIGHQLLNYFIESRSKNMLTIHIRKELKRTVRFYRKFGFTLTNQEDNHNEILSAWVDKCLKYNPNTYCVNMLMNQHFDQAVN